MYLKFFGIQENVLSKCPNFNYSFSLVFAQHSARLRVRARAADFIFCFTHTNTHVVDRMGAKQQTHSAYFARVFHIAYIRMRCRVL